MATTTAATAEGGTGFLKNNLRDYGLLLVIVAGRLDPLALRWGK